MKYAADWWCAKWLRAGPLRRLVSTAATSYLASTAKRPKNLMDFYRKIWAMGAAGVPVPLDVLKQSAVKRIDIKSINRLDNLKTCPSI
jgi:hypothetical protein